MTWDFLKLPKVIQSLYHFLCKVLQKLYHFNNKHYSLFTINSRHSNIFPSIFLWNIHKILFDISNKNYSNNHFQTNITLNPSTLPSQLILFPRNFLKLSLLQNIRSTSSNLQRPLFYFFIFNLIKRKYFFIFFFLPPIYSLVFALFYNRF